MKLNLVTLAVIVIGLSLFGMHAAHQPWTAWRIAGIAIAAPAFLLFVAARIELGRAFSVQAKATTLVTTGVYSRIRNPIYFFGAIFFLGTVSYTHLDVYKRQVSNSVSPVLAPESASRP